MEQLNALRGGGGGAMVFLSQQTIFFHFQDETIILFPLWSNKISPPPPPGMKQPFFCPNIKLAGTETERRDDILVFWRERLVKGGDILDTCIGLFPLLWGLLDKFLFSIGLLNFLFLFLFLSCVVRTNFFLHYLLNKL